MAVEYCGPNRDRLFGQHLCLRVLFFIHTPMRRKYDRSGMGDGSISAIVLTAAACSPILTIVKKNGGMMLCGPFPEPCRERGRPLHPSVYEDLRICL